MSALPTGHGTRSPADKVLLADGAWGTELMRLELVQGQSSEAWNLNDSDAVPSVARVYAAATTGLRVIASMTYNGRTTDTTR